MRKVKMYYMQNISIRLIILLFVLIAFNNQMYSQSNYNDHKNSVSGKRTLKSSRNYTRELYKPSNPLNEEGLVKYRKIAIMDGNLVTGPIINSGLISIL